jgi:four helix bundle protein
MAIHNFRKLEVWQNAMNLVGSVYSLIKEIPSDERFGLKSQVAKCSVSVPSNIAEGSGRGTNKDFSRFLDIALGSSYELETQLIIIKDVFNIDSESVIIECQQVQRMIFNFKKRILTDK